MGDDSMTLGLVARRRFRLSFPTRAERGWGARSAYGSRLCKKEQQIRYTLDPGLHLMDEDMSLGTSGPGALVLSSLQEGAMLPVHLAHAFENKGAVVVHAVGAAFAGRGQNGGEPGGALAVDGAS